MSDKLLLCGMSFSFPITFLLKGVFFLYLSVYESDIKLKSRLSIKKLNKFLKKNKTVNLFHWNTFSNGLVHLTLEVNTDSKQSMISMFFVEQGRHLLIEEQNDIDLKSALTPLELSLKIHLEKIDIKSEHSDPSLLTNYMKDGYVWINSINLSRFISKTYNILNIVGKH